MPDRVKSFLFDLVSAVQAGKIYPASHPAFQEYLNKSFLTLKEIVSRSGDLTIGIIGSDMAYGDQIIFDLPQKTTPLIAYFKERGIERIWFDAKVTREDLTRFFVLLMSSEKMLSEDIQAALLAEGIHNIRIGKIQAPSGTGPGREEAATDLRRDEREVSVTEAVSMLDGILKGESVALADIKLNVLNLLQHFALNPCLIPEFVPRESGDLSLVAHCLGTALLSMSFASGLGYGQADVADIGIAALLHDTGLFIPAGEAGSVVEDHSLRGAKALLAHVETLGFLPVVVAAEHRGRFDLQTDLPPVCAVTPHPVSRLVAVCNVYERLIRREFESGGFSPPRVRDELLKERGTVYDPEVLDDFFRLMGVWPVGTPVILNDDRIAIVRKSDFRDPLRPQVEVVFPEEKRGWISLADQVELRIDRVLDPAGEGKKYIDR